MKMRNSQLSMLTLLLWQLSPNLALANEESSPQAPIENITVTALRSPMAITDIPATVWVIDQAQLSREIATGVDLKNMLGKLIPSLDFGNETRTNFSQNLRGRRALVMIDGVSLNSTRQISRQLDSIDPFNIERLEVLSGATALYGAGAAGGIINIITKNAANTDKQAEAFVSLTCGFNNSHDLNRKLGLAGYLHQDALNTRLALAFERTRAAFDADGERILTDITQTDTQFNDTKDVQLNLDYRASLAASLSFMGQFYQSEQNSHDATYLGPNLAGIFGFPDFIEIRSGLSLADQPRTQRNVYHLQFNHQDVLGQQLLAQVFHRQEAFRFFPFPFLFQVQGSPFPGDAFPVFGSSEQRTEVSGIKGVMLNKSALGQLTYGIDADTETFAADQTIYDIFAAFGSGGLVFDPIQRLTRYPSIDSKHYAGFAQFSSKLTTNWSVTAGFRYQKTQHEVSDFTGLLQQHLAQLGLYPIAPQPIEGGKNHYSDWLFNLGVVHELNANAQVWANLSQGFDLPDPARYYGQGQYNGRYGEGPVLIDAISVSNHPLSGVKTDSLEFGWRKTTDQAQWQLSAYYSLSDKTTAFDASSLSIVVNDDERRIYGLEGQLRYDFSDVWYASVQAHLLKSHTKFNGEWQDLTAAEASPNTATLRLGYQHDAFSLELQLQTLRDYQDEAGQRLEGYHLAHLNGYYQLKQGKVSFGIQNLLDKQYQTQWSQRAQIIYGTLSTPTLFDYPGQGRRFSLSYELAF